jgi:hypothetical protein
MRFSGGPVKTPVFRTANLLSTPFVKILHRCGPQFTWEVSTVGRPKTVISDSIRSSSVEVPMRKSLGRFLIIINLNFITCIAGLAGTKHAPLPEQILEAKTVYIDNRSGLAYIGDRAFDEMSKWGRFKIIKSAKDADVVILFSAKEYVRGYRTTSTGTSQGTVDDSGDVRLNHDSTSRTTAQTGGIALSPPRPPYENSSG